MKWMHRTLFPAIVCVVVLLGCGDRTITPEEDPGRRDEDDEGTARVVQVVLTEYRIDMVTTLDAGLIEFRVSNAGAMLHNFAIEGNGVSRQLGADLAGGGFGVLQLELAAGTYRVYCPVSNHAELGMELELTVNSPG